MGETKLTVEHKAAAASGKQIRVAIAGAGLSGILMGIRLKQRGMHNFRIFEKASSLGGTWRDNKYPGIACDVPAQAYVYSFALNPNYTMRYEGGAKILAYYTRVAKKYGITEHISYDSEVASAQWNGAVWTITTKRGEEMEAEVFVSACGRLHHPVIPDIPGLRDFAGPWFHSARWDTNVDIKGKRLGVVGSGSSGVQIIARLAGEVEKLVAFQRTPHWFIDLPNPKLSLAKRLKLKFIPGEAKKYYDKLHAIQDMLSRQRMTSGRELAAYAHAALEKIRDPELRRKLTPNYEVGCKRMVLSSEFSEAIQRPNVELETGGIDRVEKGGVRMKDGRFHPLDILCLATGFKTDAYMRPMTLTGKNGMTLDELWRENYLNYRTIGLPHMPNFFMINGPFSPGGTTPIVRIAEIQTNYIMQLIDKIAESGIALSPKEERARELVAEVQADAKKTVWATGGCQSWYLDRNGVPLVDPILPPDMAAAMARAHFEDFIHEPLAAV